MTLWTHGDDLITRCVVLLRVWIAGTDLSYLPIIRLWWVPWLLEKTVFVEHSVWVGLHQDWREMRWVAIRDARRDAGLMSEVFQLIGSDPTRLLKLVVVADPWQLEFVLQFVKLLCGSHFGSVDESRIVYFLTSYQTAALTPGRGQQCAFSRRSADSWSFPFNSRLTSHVHT